MSTACACGEAAAHVIARRLSADGVGVSMWDDGSILGRFGALPGVPIVRPRTAAARAAACAAGWMLMGMVELYDAAEIPDLYAAIRWAVERGADAEAARLRFERSRSLVFAWTVQQTDRDGRPTLRTCKLDRIRFAGLAVFHERGVYQLAKEIGRTGTYEPTGFVFRSQRELSAHLRTIGTL